MNCQVVKGDIVFADPVFKNPSILLPSKMLYLSLFVLDSKCIIVLFVSKKNVIYIKGMCSKKKRPNSARAMLAFPVTYFPIRNRIRGGPFDI